MPLKFNTLLRAILAGSGVSTPSYYLNLSSPSNVTIADGQANGTITSTYNAVITASMSPSRTTGVAPLYVNFDMTGTTSTDSTNPTHECFFATDFGDSGAGTWANGVQSAGLTSKNAGYGPVTGHVYETPGTYTVTMSVTDGVNTATKTGTIVVQDPDVVYAGTDTICLSHSGNFIGAPSGSSQPTITGNTDMYSLLNTYKASNKRILFCKADSWTCSTQNTLTGISGMTISGYGTGVARSGVFNASASDTLVSVTPSALGGSVFNLNAGNSDIRIHNFKITSNSTTKASALNNSVDGYLISKVEIRGCSAGFSAYPGGGGTNNVFDQHCMYECLVDDLDSGAGAGGISAFVGLVRGGVIGCYFDSCNYGEQTMRIPYIDRGHINNNYIARPNKTKNVVKIHSFDYTQVALYSEKFVFAANVLDLRGGYSYNGTTVTEVGDCGIIIGNGGVGGGERVRNGIVESNYTYGCRGEPKAAYFVSVNCPNMTVRNNIADFALGDGSSSFTPVYTYPTAVFAHVGISTTDPTINVQIYNNMLYTNMVTSESPVAWLRNGAGALAGVLTDHVTVKNNISYQPFAASNKTQIVYNPDGVVHVTASNNTADKTTNPNFTATPPVTTADWKPATGSYAINGGASVPVLRDFNNVTRVGAGNHMGAILP